MAQKSNEWRMANNACLSCQYFNEILETERHGRIMMSVDCKHHGITNVRSMGCEEFKLYLKPDKEPTIKEMYKDLLQWCDPMKGATV